MALENWTTFCHFENRWLKYRSNSIRDYRSNSKTNCFSLVRGFKNFTVDYLDGIIRT